MLTLPTAPTLLLTTLTMPAFAGNSVTLRFVLASIAVLGGIALVILRAPSRRG